MKSNIISKLRKENLDLRDEISKLKAAIAGAKCYLVFWDHGVYETKNSLLDNIDKARDILTKASPNSTYIIKLFENWLKQRPDIIVKDKSKLTKKDIDQLFSTCEYSEYFGDYSMRLCNHPENKKNHTRPNCGYCRMHVIR